MEALIYIAAKQTLESWLYIQFCMCSNRIARREKCDVGLHSGVLEEYHTKARLT
jgi:hypothetical protein